MSNAKLFVILMLATMPFVYLAGKMAEEYGLRKIAKEGIIAEQENLRNQYYATYLKTPAGSRVVIGSDTLELPNLEKGGDPCVIGFLNDKNNWRGGKGYDEHFRLSFDICYQVIDSTIYAVSRTGGQYLFDANELEPYYPLRNEK